MCLFWSQMLISFPLLDRTALGIVSGTTSGWGLWTGFPTLTELGCKVWEAILLGCKSARLNQALLGNHLPMANLRGWLAKLKFSTLFFFIQLDAVEASILREEGRQSVGFFRKVLLPKLYNYNYIIINYSSCLTSLSSSDRNTSQFCSPSCNLKRLYLEASLHE